MNDTSILPYLEGKTASVHPADKVHVWELFGRRGVRKGKWKAEWMEKPSGKETWELYDLSTDISQQHNLATTQSKILAELINDWEDYVKNNNVKIPDRPTVYAKETIWRE